MDKEKIINECDKWLESGETIVSGGDLGTLWTSRCCIELRAFLDKYGISRITLRGLKKLIEGLD